MLALAAPGSFKVSDYINTIETTILAPLTCHIVEIVNLAESKEKALEEWKYYHNPNTAPFERMEHVNRPIIYGIDLEADEQPRQVTTKGTYKLTLKDSSDNYFYALEIEELPFLHPREKSTTPLPIALGGRLVIQKGTTVCEGVLFLRRHQCQYLGADADSPLVQQLNNGVVKKYMDIMEKQLRP